jgi:cyanate lyase
MVSCKHPDLPKLGWFRRAVSRLSNGIERSDPLTRDECTIAIRTAKLARGISWQQIADAIGRHVIWTTAALLGQATMDYAEAAKAAELLGRGPDVVHALQQCPTKGSLDAVVPTDPLIYRFYEIVHVYGTTLKEVIHEQFGDGIMSAIDFTMDIERVPDPKGDRVRVTMEGKFLPYKKW